MPTFYSSEENLIHSSCNIRYLSTTLLILFSLLVSACGPAKYSIREVKDPGSRYLAYIDEGRPGHYFVVYNPQTCEQVGHACEFFRSQVYAHARLNHPIYDQPHFYTAQLESQADCWAAKYASTAALNAAVEIFEDEQRARELRLYGDFAKRAERIRQCAQL